MDANTKRLLLFMLFAFALLQIYGALNPPPPKPVGPPPAAVTPGPASADAPTSATAPSAAAPLPGSLEAPPAPSAPLDPPGREIVLQTDFFRVTFTSAGAYPVRWQIIDPRFARASQSDVEEHAKKGVNGMHVGDPLPIELIPEYPDLPPGRDYPLMVVLKQTSGPFLESLNHRTYTVDGPTSATDGSISIRFTSPSTPEGIRLVKRFRFVPGSYLAQLAFSIENAAGEKAQNLDFSEPTQPGLGVIWGPGIGETHFTAGLDASMYRTAAYDGETIFSSPFKGWEKLQGNQVLEHSFDGKFRWGLVESSFYMAALAPRGDPSPVVRGIVKPQHVPRDPALRKMLATPFTTEVYSGGFQLRPGDTRTVEFNAFVGPKKRQLLVAIDRKEDLGLRKILFHDSIWLIRVLAVFMLDLLGWLYNQTHNYGVAIILLTLIMRLITQPLTHIGMKSQARVMAEQQRIKPLIDAINEKYKEDPQKRNSEIWKTYREHGVNPLGMMKGCIWMLVQLPIFFALYRLLNGAIDLRGESFLWIKDLTAPDALFSWSVQYSLPIIGHKFNILPILMGLSQMAAQRLQTTNVQDPSQKMMMTLMPVVFIFVLYDFAAGLSLYWFVSNLWQITFQIFINKKVKEEAERRAQKAFEERQKAVQAGAALPRKKGAAAPGWREKMMRYLEAKAREAEKGRRK